jgi:TonB family protein
MNKIVKHGRTAILASVILHALAFIIFTGVKLYNREPSIEGKVSVAFVKVQNVKPMRRSTLFRQMVSISKMQQNPIQKQEIIRPTYESSEVFYTDAPEKIFSIAGSIDREGSKVQLIARPPSIKKLQPIVSPAGIAILKETHPSEIQLQPRVISGRDFLKEVKPIQVKPNTSDILQRFTQNVRRRIESKKIYPLAARKSMLEGQVGLKITLLKSGQLETVEIIESSGHAILDKAAVESARKAAPFPSLPEGVERERVQMSIYLVFKMT